MCSTGLWPLPVTTPVPADPEATGFWPGFGTGDILLSSAGGGCIAGGTTGCPSTAAWMCCGTLAKFECPLVSPAAALEAGWACQLAEEAGCG